MARRRNDDPFGFAAAIRVDHLTPEQVDMVNAIFDKPKPTESEED